MPMMLIYNIDIFALSGVDVMLHLFDSMADAVFVLKGVSMHFVFYIAM